MLSAGEGEVPDEALTIIAAIPFLSGTNLSEKRPRFDRGYISQYFCFSLL